MGNVRLEIVTRDSIYGRPAPMRDVGLPRIDDDLLQCGAYLYASVPDAERGERIGASGFLLNVPIGEKSENLSYTVCVTNRHVIENGFTVARLNAPAGVRVAEFDERHWYLHPEADLAAAIIPVHSMGAAHRSVDYEAMLTLELLEEQGVGVGDDVFMVGRFINHDGGQENIPVARFGNIAQMPGGAPLCDDFGREQESYIIECRSIGGFSGSPVFVRIPPYTWRPEKGDVTREYFGDALLGVNWCHSSYVEPVLGPDGKESRTGHVRSHTGLAGVIPAWRLVELLESDLFKAALSDPLPVTTWGADYEQDGV